jgi:phosphohistidine phosphatase
MVRPETAVKTLILLRHAAAGASKDGTDERRPLSAEGVLQARRTAARLAVRSVKPDRIVTSPADRALATARIVAEALETDDGRFLADDRVYDASESGHLLRVIRGLDDADGVVVIVGHQPVLGELTTALVPMFSVPFPRAGAACIALDVASWKEVAPAAGSNELIWFETH